MKTNTSNKTDINTLKNRKEKTNMKTTSIKMIIALALALTLVCALGTSAFADFMSPYGYVTINIDGSRTLYLDDGTRITRFPDGSIVSFDPPYRRDHLQRRPFQRHHLLRRRLLFLPKRQRLQ